MMSENRNLFKRRLLFALMIFAAFLIQSTPRILPDFFAVSSFPLLPLVICIAMFERETWGAAAGLLAGAMWDSTVSRGQGYYGIFLMLAGFACGFLVRYIMRNNFMAALTLTASFSLLNCFLFWLLFIVIGGVPGSAYLLWRFYLPSAVLTILWLPIWYFSIRAIMKALHKVTGEEEE